MVDLERLAERARWAAEWGRARRASRFVPVVVLMTLLGTVISPFKGAVAAIGVLLLGFTFALAWTSRPAERAARAGVKFGALPMALAFFTLLLDRWCGPGGAAKMCGVGCLLAGAIAGGASTWQALQTTGPGRLHFWTQIGIVASLTSALGCVGLGMGSLLAVLGAMAAGAVVGWVPRRVQ